LFSLFLNERKEKSAFVLYFLRSKTVLFCMVDRTVDFRSAAAERAQARGVSLQQPVRTRGPFHRAVAAVQLGIIQAADFIRENRKSLFGLEQVAADAERRIRDVLRKCGDQVDQLRSMTEQRNRDDEDDEDAAQKPNQDTEQYVHGLLACMYARLESLSSVLSKARVARARTAVTSLRPESHVRLDASLPATIVSDVGLEGPRSQEDRSAAQLELENRMLAAELSTVGDAVQETERRLRAVADLHEMFATRVAQQASDIDHLYDAAVSATVNAKRVCRLGEGLAGFELMMMFP
jgi:hypothetical protein